MAWRTICLSVFLSVMFTFKFAWAQQSGDPLNLQATQAYQLFHQGKLKTAIKALQDIIVKMPTPAEKARLQVELLEMCATAFDWNCVGRTIQEMLPALQSDQTLRPLYPRLIVYEFKLMQWIKNDQYFIDIIKKGGASAFTNIASNPVEFAEIELTIASFLVNRNELTAAESHISAAILSLLVIDQNNVYGIEKVLLGIIQILIAKHDVLGAIEIYTACEDFLSKNIPEGSPLRAQYQLISGDLFSFTPLNSKTASAFLDAARLFRGLDVDDSANEYQISLAIDLATAAKVIDRNFDEARAIFAQHPLHDKKEFLLKEGVFQTITQFYFAITDIFLAAASGGAVDERWKALFDNVPKWNLEELQLTEIQSFRNYALGSLKLRTDPAEAHGLLIQAARERINNFDKVLRLNLEGIQIPGLVDKIVIAAGLSSAVKIGDQQSLDLMLRGSDVILRNVRHRLVDIASILSFQRNFRWRSNIHSYFHLVDKKRQWELENIRKLLSKSLPFNDRGRLISEAIQAVTEVRRLKDRIASDSGFQSDWGVPTLEQVQQSLEGKQVFISYFPFFGGGIGKICVSRERALFAVTQATPEVLEHVQKFQAAVSNEPRSAEWVNEFPFASATYLSKFLFGGLEKCLLPGTSVTVALPPEFAGVPLGALLKEEPSHDPIGYDVRNASWLIQDLSFAAVISARHFLATAKGFDHKTTARPFLGVGNPIWDKTKLASTEAFKRSLRTRNGISDFQELPETVGEIEAVSKLLGASDTDILLGKRGTEEAFRAKPLGDYDVIHFATHGLIKDDILGLSESALLLTPGDLEDSFDDGLLTASEIARLSLNARLVVLSACNTAKYDLAHVGRSVQDLQGAFTIAGTPTLLASLWPVDSAAAQYFATIFFINWRSAENNGPSDALAKATRTYLASSSSNFLHPWFWAPYLIAGNGTTHANVTPRQSKAAKYSIFGEFSSGGEIISAARLGSDILFAMTAEWDGSKLNNIISRRTAAGAEKWREGSRAIGIGRIATNKEVIYSTGYTTEQEPIPVFRAFEQGGRLKWKTELDTLRGYRFLELVATSNGIFTVGTPLSYTGTASHALVLHLDNSGNVHQRAEIKLESRNPVIGSEALIGGWGSRVVLVINHGSSIGSKPPDENSISGLRTLCYTGASTSIMQLDQKTLKVLAAFSMPNFQATSFLASENDLFVGGETFRECSNKGIASIFRVEAAHEPHLLWKDGDEIFNSAVRGIVSVGSNLVAALGHERRLGVDIPVFKGFDIRKRWTEEGGRREGSLVTLTKKGAVISEQWYSAGMSIYPQGVEASRDDLIVYGTLGGLPWTAVTDRPAQPAAARRMPLETNKKQIGPWWRFW